MTLIPLDEVENRPTVASVPDKVSTADAQNLGPSNVIQYTAPKPPPSLLERGAEDVEKPFIQAQHTLGASMSWLGDNIKDETPFGDLGTRIGRAGIVMQERATTDLKDKFSNFTPNMFDDLIGAVPTIAGFMGLAAASTTAIATGAIAASAGFGIGAEEFGKFKSMGKTTPQADALAVAIGAPAGGVMAMGFGRVAELVEPWFTKTLGSTVTKIVGERAALLVSKAAGASAAGAVGMGAQSATTDTGEQLSGAAPKDALKILTDSAHNAIMGGVLGGGLGMSFALREHANVITNLQKLGFTPTEANQSATALLGQGAHVLMDKIDQHLDYTKDENARIQAPTAEGEVQPNILERSGIPKDLDYQPADKEAMPDSDVVQMSKDFKYVKLRPLNILSKLPDKAGAEEARKKFLGARDQQLLDNSHMHKDWLKTAPTDLEQKGLFWGERSPEFIKLAVEEPHAASIQVFKELKEFTGRKQDATKDEIDAMTEQLIARKAIFEQILNPTEGMKQVAEEGKTYYKEQGTISKAMGTINEIKENYYSSRLYKAAPLGDFVKNLKSINKKFSAHSLERYYPDKFMALADGKEFRTENFADTTYDHVTEMTQVNYSRQLQNALTELKPAALAAWIREGAMPGGWQQIGTSRKLVYKRDRQTGELQFDEDGNPQSHYVVFGAPKAFAEGLKPLTDPNYLKTIPGYEALDKLQAFAKTGLLSASFFHHYTFATQTMASFDGYKTLAELPAALKNDLMSEPGFRDLERRGVKYGMTTQEIHNIQDVWAEMNKGEDRFSKVLQAPVIKNVVDAVDANTDLLFKGIQRYIKTMTFSRNMAKWEGEHPNASQEEIDAAGYGYAKGTNDAFGGQNWEMLGWNRTQVALARMFLLAPDWVVSNLSASARALKGVVNLSDTAGSQARWTLVSGIIGGLAMNNLLNYMRNGHSTFENKKGHEFEAEVAPDVYVNNVRGSPGELLKLTSDVIESEGAQGFARYAEGKQSPVLSAYTRFSSGVNYSGASIWRGDSALERNVNGFWNIMAPMIGVPIGATGIVDYLQREQDKSLLGFSLTASGLARFSKQGARWNF